MLELRKTKKEIDPKDFLGKTPDLNHVGDFVECDTLVTDEAGKPLILYIKLRESTSRLAIDNPPAHKELCAFGSVMMPYYQQYFPEVLKQHEEDARAKIKDDWRILGTPFTSGIVNYNSAIKYHFDAGNIKDCASNMILLTKDVEGGDFIVPEYDIAFKNKTDYLFIFDGQGILHGVTPIRS